jgi:hypothetical protein
LNLRVAYFGGQYQDEANALHFWNIPQRERHKNKARFFWPPKIGTHLLKRRLYSTASARVDQNGRRNSSTRERNVDAHICCRHAGRWTTIYRISSHPLPAGSTDNPGIFAAIETGVRATKHCAPSICPLAVACCPVWLRTVRRMGEWLSSPSLQPPL